jgi:hypothetical protein
VTPRRIPEVLDLNQYLLCGFNSRDEFRLEYEVIFLVSLSLTETSVKVSSTESVEKSAPTNCNVTAAASCPVLLIFLFVSEDGGDMFFRNVLYLLPIMPCTPEGTAARTTNLT